MKQIVLKTIFILVILITITNTIYAGERACALISSERGGLESEGDRSMQNAKNTYDRFGYSTSILKDPSALLVMSNALSSKVQLYCCHGNTNFLEFPNGGLHLGGDIVMGGKEYYGIERVDWSTKKLITLAACNTAGVDGSDSYAIAPQLVRAGAQMSIGWYTEVNPFSMPDWLDHFHKEMDNGYDPLGAVNRANNEYWYFNGNVRNTLVSYKTLSTLSENTIEQKFISENNILAPKEISKIEKTQIEKKIKEYDTSFNVNDYEKNYSDGLYTFNAETDEIKHLYSYIDYTFKIGAFLTNSGYTVVLNDNDLVCQIIDNTKKISDSLKLESISKSNNSFYNTNQQYYLNKAKENISNKNDILEEDIKFYFDLDKNRKYANVTIKVKDAILGFKLLTYTFEITT